MSRRRRAERRAPTWDDVGALARAVLAVEEPAPVALPALDLGSMTVAQLRQHARDHGIDLKGARLKVELITVLSA